MSLKRNIPLMYVIGALMWSRFFLPVLALFYMANNVSLEQFGIILGVFSLTIFLLEVPTGVISDFIGRKNTLLLSRVFYVLEILIICLFDGFWPFLIAKIISGIGVSLGSGTNESMLYETLKKTGREKEHRKIFGNSQAISNVSMALIFIVGAYLFSINPKLPAYVSLPFITLGLILTFFLEEPYPEKKRISFKKTLNHFAEGIRLFFSNKEFVLITLFSVPVILIFEIASTISSEYLKQVLIPVSLIGVVAAIGSLIYAYSAQREHIVENKIGSKNMIYLLISANAISLLLMIFLFPYVGALAYLIIPGIAGFGSVFINHYMNVRIGESHRATMLSIKNMFNSLGLIVIFPIAGKIENVSLPYTYLFLGGILIIFFGAFVFYRRYHHLELETR